MVLILEAIVIGILVGSIYALMASGLTLIFGVMDIINVAQGIFVVLGSYFSYALERNFHIDIFLGLLLTMPIMFVIGVVIEWAFLRRIRRNRVMLSIMAMYAIALLFEGLLNYFFSATPVQLQASYVDASFKLFDYYVPYVQLFSFILSVVLLGGLYLLVYRTKFGHSLRATMQNRTAATLIGIDVENVSAITFGIGMALAAVGGMAFGATNSFNAASSYDLISRLLVIVVLGGLGSLTGTLFASIFMVTIAEITTVVWSPIWSTTVFFVFLIILLLFRPQGLSGLFERRKQ